MPVATVPIYARTLLGLIEDVTKRSAGNGTQIPIIIVCNAFGCKKAHTMNTEKRVFVCGEFRCMNCFSKLVRNQKLAFGVSEEATDEEIENLLEAFKPSEIGMKPFATNLFQLKKTPRFVAI
jgi:hypothetical protein